MEIGKGIIIHVKEIDFFRVDPLEFFPQTFAYPPIIPTTLLHLLEFSFGILNRGLRKAHYRTFYLIYLYIFICIVFIYIYH